MDLWVRSQDKERLIKPIDFYIEETIDYVNKHSEFDIYALNLANDDIRIGTYATKERALEVLGEIQNILKPKIMLKYNDDLTMSVSSIEQQPTTCVYEMPEE